MSAQARRGGAAHSSGRCALRVALPLLIIMVGWACPATALEKYGGSEAQSFMPLLEEQEKEKTKERGAEETWLGGYLLEGVFLDNPSFTARPNNTGLVGLRHMAHLETDLYQQYLSFYTDQNFMSNRQQGWIKLTEWDMTYGLTGLLGRRWGWRVQYERDAPLDESGLKQIYADALITYHIQAYQDWSWWRRLFPDQQLLMYAGPGYFLFNSKYFARPDNTGLVLLRYVAHFDLLLYRDIIVLFGDANMFTDRDASCSICLSELDWMLGVAFRWHGNEISIYREQDRPMDRSGFVQQYIAVQLRIPFDIAKRKR